MSSFQGCEATVKFIRNIDRLFDLLNSRLPWAKGFKGPLKESNIGTWRPFFDAISTYLLNLKDVEGQLLHKSQKKTPILGFVITITSFIGIFDEYITKKKLSYLLTYKMSQDHLELFFCSVR